MTDKIDELVDLITKRVTERLQTMNAAPSYGERKTSDCVNSQGSCTNCGLCVVKKPEAVDNIINFGASRIGANAGVGKIDTKMASMIDHTLLKPDATQAELTKICTEAKDYHFATVCVNSSNIPFVARLLKGSDVKAIAVVGFPLGAATSQAKAFEAKEAIHAGAEEIDMVINIGAIKSKDYKTVYEDIRQVVEASKPYAVKVILETSNLDHDEKVLACALSKTAGAAFVKTSTGFGSGGATVEDIALMRKIVGENMHVKASGGIRTKEDAEKMVNAGADRIGASASVAIVTGKQAKAGNY
ncbi:MAG: deoxyribose-phosphate aldolase [uncultured bacterium]|nr:MAG: deoxyribose-phosphate aldolase [uncultured bacterium]